MGYFKKAVGAKGLIMDTIADIRLIISDFFLQPKIAQHRSLLNTGAFE